MALPDTNRDGDLVRNLKFELIDQEATLGTLYAHWEEANELNG